MQLADNECSVNDDSGVPENKFGIKPVLIGCWKIGWARMKIVLLPPFTLHFSILLLDIIPLSFVINRIFSFFNFTLVSFLFCSCSSLVSLISIFRFFFQCTDTYSIFFCSSSLTPLFCFILRELYLSFLISPFLCLLIFLPCKDFPFCSLIRFLHFLLHIISRFHTTLLFYTHYVIPITSCFMFSSYDCWWTG